MLEINLYCKDAIFNVSGLSLVVQFRYSSKFFLKNIDKHFHRGHCPESGGKRNRHILPYRKAN